MEIYEDYSVLRENEYTQIVFEDHKIKEYDPNEDDTCVVPEEEDQWVEDNFENIRQIHDEITYWSGFFQKLKLNEFVSYLYYTNVEHKDSNIDLYNWYVPQEHPSFAKCNKFRKFVSTHWKSLVDYHDYLERSYDYLFGSNELFMKLAYNWSFKY